MLSSLSKSGLSSVVFGLCPGSRDWIKEKSGNPYQGRDYITAPPEVPKYLDDTDNVMRHLAAKKINAFSGIGHGMFKTHFLLCEWRTLCLVQSNSQSSRIFSFTGFFFWNFRTDLYEPQWSYMAALERGWIPKGDLNAPEVADACSREDNGAYRCVVKKGQLDSSIISAVSYIYDVQNKTGTPEAKAILHQSGSDLYDSANTLIDSFFQAHRLAGVTCDFGGLTM